MLGNWIVEWYTSFCHLSWLYLYILLSTFGKLLSNQVGESKPVSNLRHRDISFFKKNQVVKQAQMHVLSLHLVRRC